MAVIDLKLMLQYDHSNRNKKGGMVNEHRKNRFCSVVGFFTNPHISQMCRTLPWQLPSKKFFMLESIPLHGLCSTYLQGKSPGYRVMPSCYATEIISHGHTCQSFPKHSCLHQRESRLAYLCRLCSNADSYSQKVICRRRFWCRVRSNRLRTRFDDHRFMPFTFSMGQVPEAKGSRQDAYSSRSTWQHTDIYPNHRRESSRRQYLGRHFPRTRFFLRA